MAWGPGETESTLTLCLCNGRPCDRCRCQCIHPLRRGAVHLPWRRWIGLCFFPHLRCVINLQRESMEESALRLWAAGRYTHRQAGRGSFQGPEDKHHLGDGKRRCLNACCSRPPRSPWLSKEEAASTIFVPAPEYNLSWMKIASLGRFSSNRPSTAPLPSHILHWGLVSLYLLPRLHHMFSAPFHKIIRLWAKRA